MESRYRQATSRGKSKMGIMGRGRRVVGAFVGYGTARPGIYTALFGGSDRYV